MNPYIGIDWAAGNKGGHSGSTHHVLTSTTPDMGRLFADSTKQTGGCGEEALRRIIREELEAAEARRRWVAQPGELERLVDCWHRGRG